MSESEMDDMINDAVRLMREQLDSLERTKKLYAKMVHECDKMLTKVAGNS